MGVDVQNKHLYRALREHKLHDPSHVYKGLTMQHANVLADRLAPQLVSAENFVLDHEVDFEQIEEIWASADALRECKLLRLPAPVCYFEMPHNSTLHDDEINETYNVSGHICALAVDCDDAIVIHPFLHIALENVKEIPSNWEMFMQAITLHKSDPALDFVDSEAFYLEENPNFQNYRSIVQSKKAAVARAFYMVMFSIVMLNTRWVEKRPVSKGLAKLLSRNKPSNGHTVIAIRKHGQPVRTNENRNVAEERLKVRLHLRRGHTRMQPFGPAKQLEKKIWIEPTLVGYAGEGVVLHDYKLKD